MPPSAKKQLSTLEATMLVTGSGLGTGILAVPYLVARLGLLQAALAIGAACGVSILLHLMVADLALHSEDSTQLLGIFRQHLFRGKWKNIGTTAFFAVLLVMLLFNLALYTVCAAEVLAGATGLSVALCKLVFYLVASLVVALGVKSIGVSEKISMLLIGAVVLVLGAITLPRGAAPLPFSSGSPAVVLALYSISMFSFSALFSVPQVVHYIRDAGKIRRCVALGIGCNAALTLAFALIVAMAGGPVTAVATVGLAARYGAGVQALCALFVLLAMLTSFLSIALAQIEILEEKTHMPGWAAWLLATLPVLAASLLLPLAFIDYIELVGGAFAVIVVFMVLPAYRRATAAAPGPLLLGRAGKSRPVLLLVFLAYIAMAAASFIPVQ